MNFLRTPDERFDNLPDWPWAPNYLQVADGEGGELRVHYIDEGPRDAPVVLLMHGQPAWSYLYRHMIQPLLDAGFRVLAPDLIGFGRSDKPTREEDYTYARHIGWMQDWLDQVGIRDITLFCQDWGSLIGLRLVAADMERFAAVVLSNGGLPAGMVPEEFTAPLREAYQTLPVVEAEELGARFVDRSGIPGFMYWRKFCAENPRFTPGALMQSFGHPIADAEAAAFDAPYPDAAFMAGARRFPSLVPLFHDEPQAAENRQAFATLCEFDKPFMCAFADQDPVTAGADKPFIEHVKGARGVPHRSIENAGHFVQQEQPAACVQALLDVTGRNS